MASDSLPFQFVHSRLCFHEWRAGHFCLVLALFVGAAARLQAQSDTLSIMPLGDSITVGASADAPGQLVPGGYRAPLYTDLEQQGINVTYEGVSDQNPSPALGTQTSHNGFGGYTVSDLDNNLEGVATPVVSTASNDGGYWLDGGHGTGRGAETPDVILLMIGTNDIGYNPEDAGSDAALVQDTVSQYKLLLGNLVYDEPQATILVGSILPFYSYSAVEDVDTSLQSLIATNFSSDKVDYVDFYDTFNNPADPGTLNPIYDGGDGIHPNAAGYAEMATIWDQAIQDDVNLPDYGIVPEPSTYALFAGGALALFAWRKFRRTS